MAARDAANEARLRAAANAAAAKKQADETAYYTKIVSGGKTLQLQLFVIHLPLCQHV